MSATQATKPSGKPLKSILNAGQNRGIVNIGKSNASHRIICHIGK